MPKSDVMREVHPKKVTKCNGGEVNGQMSFVNGQTSFVNDEIVLHAGQKIFLFHRLILQFLAKSHGGNLAKNGLNSRGEVFFLQKSDQE